MSRSGSGTNTPTNNPSLPARPTGPLPSFDNRHGHGGYGRNNQNQGYGQQNSAMQFKPRSVGGNSGQGWQQQNYNATVSAPAVSAPAAQSNYGGYSNATYQAQPEYYNQQQQYGNYGGQGYGNANQAAAVPQIKNPFVPVSQSSGGGAPGSAPLDPDYEQQMLQWQNAYANKDESKKAEGNPNQTPVGARPVNVGPVLSNQEIAAAAPTGSKSAAVVQGKDGKEATVVRSGGGKTWQDDSLLEWDPAHPRLFIGNLAGEVTDDSLYKAFSKYPSIVKTKVVRDRKTTKSKGYGFVSFRDADDYLKAFKDMQGKYIGSHPVLIKKSNTEIKAVDPNKNKHNHRNKNNKFQKGGKNVTNANTGAGVKKGQPKTRDGMVLLG